jgi:hypothetical protein
MYFISAVHWEVLTKEYCNKKFRLDTMSIV